MTGGLFSDFLQVEKWMKTLDEAFKDLLVKLIDVDVI